MDACSRAGHWLSAGLLTLGLLAPAGGFVSHTGAAAAAAGEELMLVNVKTGKCLTIAGGVSTDNNVQAVQFDCDSDPSRRWTLTPGSGADVYQVKNVQTGKCLTIAGGVKYGEQHHGPPVRLRQPPFPHLENRGRDGRRRLPNSERADQQVPHHCRWREHRQQRHGAPVQLRHRSVAPLDAEAEALTPQITGVRWLDRRYSRGKGLGCWGRATSLDFELSRATALMRPCVPQ